jgi:hypothetical protein
MCWKFMHTVSEGMYGYCGFYSSLLLRVYQLTAAAAMQLPQYELLGHRAAVVKLLKKLCLCVCVCVCVCVC